MSGRIDAGRKAAAPKREGSPRTSPSEDAGLDALHDALRDLRAGIEERSAPVVREQRSVTEGDWMSSLGSARRRLGTLGMAERSGEVDDFGVDPQALQRLRPFLDFLQDRFWRVEVLGLNRLPDEPLLIVANRSGPLPYDGVMLSHAIARAKPHRPSPRFLVEEGLMTLPFVQPYLARIGGVLSCPENADRLLRAGHTVLAFPEGEAGAGKMFSERYRLQPFGGGDVVRTALENRAPLVPVGIVGAEEAHPVLYRPRAPGLGDRSPTLPLTPTFPWLGPLGLLPIPTKWIVEIGDPVDTEDLPAASMLDGPTLSRVGDLLRSRVQRLVDRALERRSSLWDR